MWKGIRQASECDGTVGAVRYHEAFVVLGLLMAGSQQVDDAALLVPTRAAHPLDAANWGRPRVVADNQVHLLPRAEQRAFKDWETTVLAPILIALPPSSTFPLLSMCLRA